MTGFFWIKYICKAEVHLFLLCPTAAQYLRNSTGPRTRGWEPLSYTTHYLNISYSFQL